MGYAEPTTEELLQILADSPNTDPVEEDPWGDTRLPRCEAAGPHGDCHRERGHQDGAWPAMRHVTFDRGHYDDWPVGWTAPEERLATVLHSSFGRHVGGSEDFQAGFAAALSLVRSVLKPS